MTTRTVRATGVVWGLAIVAGLALLYRSAHAAGRPATAPSHWPAGTVLRPGSPGRATLMMIAHPHCPCTRTSLGELARIMARCFGRVDAQVVFVRPPGLDERWVESDLWRAAEAIPGVRAVRDDDCAEAHRFDAHTSGQVLLYDAHGDLKFSGGITDIRGHAGDNAGHNAVVALLERGTSDAANTLVYGCPLDAPGPTATDGGDR
jgi:hypothetical protein